MTRPATRTIAMNLIAVELALLVGGAVLAALLHQLSIADYWLGALVSAGVAASTLAAAAPFSPLRVGVQRAVDHRFHRSRDDAEATVSAFAQRLRDAVYIDVVEVELPSTVQRAVEPSHASVWMAGGPR
jgi:hypothetical protein